MRLLSVDDWRFIERRLTALAKAIVKQRGDLSDRDFLIRAVGHNPHRCAHCSRQQHHATILRALTRRPLRTRNRLRWQCFAMLTIPAHACACSPRGSAMTSFRIRIEFFPLPLIVAVLFLSVRRWHEL